MKLNVRCGVNNLNNSDFNGDDVTLDYVRGQVSLLFGLSAVDHEVYVNGILATSMTTPLHEGDSVEFRKKSGAKG